MCGKTHGLIDSSTELYLVDAAENLNQFGYVITKPMKMIIKLRRQNLIRSLHLVILVSFDD